MTCLDTDLLVGFLRGEPEAVKFMARLTAGGERPKTTIFNEYELWAGAFLRDPHQTREVESLVSSLEVLQADSKSAREFGRLAAEAKKAGRQLPDLDSMVASVVLSKAETLVTRNEKHFLRIPGLKVQKW